MVRETQDKQTGGIPIGPDTSFLIGEVMGSAIDIELQDSIKARGTRFIDDYYLYFETQAGAEQGLALIHKIAKEFELEVNDPKTEILPLPEELEPAWKTELRSMRLRAGAQPQNTDLLSLFNRGFDLAKKFPSDNVLTYIARQVSSSNIDPTNWMLCESLLMKAILSEPTAISIVLDILENNANSIADKANIAATVSSLCDYHAPLEQGYEVAWALWLAKQQNLAIPSAAAKKVVMMDDDIVALVALDLLDSGLFPTIPMARWRQLLRSESLYSEHWLFAYEAVEQGWLSARSDYVGNDPVFTILRNHNVRFYNSGVPLLAVSATGYGDDEDADGILALPAADIDEDAEEA
jgi:hypothetical protein